MQLLSLPLCIIVVVKKLATVAVIVCSLVQVYTKYTYLFICTHNQAARTSSRFRLGNDCRGVSAAAKIMQLQCRLASERKKNQKQMSHYVYIHKII